MFRGLSICWIVSFHLLNGVREQYFDILNLIIKHGDLGISVFFVISGFGISTSLEKTLLNKESSFSFLKRRFLRILLPYWIHLIFAAIVIPFLMALVSTLKSHTFQLELFQYSTIEWLQLITLTKGIFADGRGNLPFLPINGVLWFVAIIIQIYIFISIALYYRKRIHVLLLLGFFVSLLTSIPYIQMHLPNGIFLGSYKHFYIGIILHRLIKNNIRIKQIKVTVLTFLLFIIIAYLSLTYCFSSFTFSLLIGFLFWMLYQYDSKFRELIIVKFFCLIGMFSYSLYLLHIPISTLIDMFVRNFVLLNASFTAPFVLMPLVILVSYIWFLFFENPSSFDEICLAVKHPVNTIKTSKHHINYLFTTASEA